MKVPVPKKSEELAWSALNSDLSLAVYRTYLYCLKLGISPTKFAYFPGSTQSTSYQNQFEMSAHITFWVLRDMGAKYVHCDPWGSDES